MSSALIEVEPGSPVPVSDKPSPNNNYTKPTPLPSPSPRIMPTDPSELAKLPPLTLTPSVFQLEHLEDKTEAEKYTILCVALEELQKQDHPKTNPLIAQCLLSAHVLKHGKKIKLQELNTSLTLMYKRLIDPKSHPEFLKQCDRMQGSPNKALRALGALMIALAVTLAALAIVYAAPVFAALGIISTAAHLITASTVGIGVLGIMLGGLGFFANSHRKGFSATMKTLDDTLNKENQVYEAPAVEFLRY
jgi:hypothetical protein